MYYAVINVTYTSLIKYILINLFKKNNLSDTFRNQSDGKHCNCCRYRGNLQKLWTRLYQSYRFPIAFHSRKRLSLEKLPGGSIDKLFSIMCFYRRFKNSFTKIYKLQIPKKNEFNIDGAKMIKKAKFEISNYAYQGGEKIFQLVTHRQLRPK